MNLMLNNKRATTTKKTVGGNSFYRNNVSERALALFLLPIAGTKEKAKQKENAVEGSFALCGGRPKALPLDSASL